MVFHAMKENEAGKEGDGGVGGRVGAGVSLNRLTEEDLPEKVTLPQVSEGDEGRSLVDVWGRTFWAEGTVH